MFLLALARNSTSAQNLSLFLQLEYSWNMELISLNCIGEGLDKLFLLFLIFL
jgi:hypothetical protein